LLRGVFSGLGASRRRRLAPQPGWDTFLLNGIDFDRDACLTEVFLRQHVTGDLAPVGRHLNVGLPEDYGSIGVADFARGRPERDGFVWRLTFGSKLTPNTHVPPEPPSCGSLTVWRQKVRPDERTSAQSPVQHPISPDIVS